MLNGRVFDRHAEIEAAETFIASMKIAMQFARDPVGISMSIAWARDNAAFPDFIERIYEALERDNR